MRAIAQAERHHAARLPVVDQQVEHHVLVEEADLVLDRLLIHRLQDHVPGAVGGVARAAHRPLAEVARVAAEAALIDLAVLGAVEGQAPVLQVVDRVDRLARQHLGGVLVDQIVAALDGVEHVPLPVVFFLVAQRRGDAALRRAGMRARGVELADDGDAGVVGQLHGRHQARAARADDHHIKLMVVHRRSSLRDLLASERIKQRLRRATCLTPGWNVMMVIDPSSQKVSAMKNSTERPPAASRASWM